MICIIAKKSGLRREINKIKKIREKASNNGSDSISNSSSDKPGLRFLASQR